MAQTQNGLNLVIIGSHPTDPEGDDVKTFAEYTNDNMVVLDPLIPDVATLKDKMATVVASGLLTGFLSGGTY